MPPSGSDESAAARFVETVVLPQPPLEEKTRMILPRRALPSPDSTLRSCSDTAMERLHAPTRASTSSATTTSRTPARSASLMVEISMRRRMRTTPRNGRRSR